MKSYATAVVILVLAMPCPVGAQETIIPLAPIPASAITGQKPQSKVWRHDGRWWTVLPSIAVSPTGTWLWRLEADHTWTNVLRLSSSTAAKADTLPVGDVTHVYLHAAEPRLVSLEYVPAQQTYTFWSVRPTATFVSVTGSETGTIALDTSGRMWLATESGTNVLVFYADFPYAAFQGPLVAADDILDDDIAAVTALPVPAPAKIGVLWSNQNTQRFGFRVHVDGEDPAAWSADEVPASQSALHVRNGMADDHLNIKVGSDGTLYAAVKTSYDTLGFPLVALLVRRPEGRWDDLYFVDDTGTRGIVLLNEPADLLRVVYADSDIVFRDSLVSAIGFGARHVLMTGPLDDPTSTKSSFTDETVVLAEGQGVLIQRTLPTTTSSSTTTSSRPPATSSSSTTSSRPSSSTSSTTTSLPPPTSSSTTTSTSTTTTQTTVPTAVAIVEVRVAASADDAEESSHGRMDLSSGDLELVQESTRQTVGIRFRHVPIARNATIVRAWVQFQVDERSTDTASLIIHGQAADHAAVFRSESHDISSRPRTQASTSWSPKPWSVVGAAGGDQRTPDLAAIVREIVGRRGWESGNALVLIVTGSGKRVAESYDGTHAGAPLLHIEVAR